jgi:hypothetical protein
MDGPAVPANRGRSPPGTVDVVEVAHQPPRARNFQFLVNPAHTRSAVLARLPATQLFRGITRVTQLRSVQPHPNAAMQRRYMVAARPYATTDIENARIGKATLADADMRDPPRATYWARGQNEPPEKVMAEPLKVPLMSGTHASLLFVFCGKYQQRKERLAKK